MGNLNSYYGASLMSTTAMHYQFEFSVLDNAKSFTTLSSSIATFVALSTLQNSQALVSMSI